MIRLENIIICRLRHELSAAAEAVRNCEKYAHKNKNM